MENSTDTLDNTKSLALLIYLSLKRPRYGHSLERASQEAVDSFMLAPFVYIWNKYTSQFSLNSPRL